MPQLTFYDLRQRVKNRNCIAKARRDDPITSHAAADKADEFIVGPHHAKILAALEKEALRSPGGMTPREISVSAAIGYHAVSRRMKELKDKGLVASIGVRNGMTVWELV